jgi:hypothetical protein
MSILSVHDIQGFSAYSNTVRVPTGHTLNVIGALTVDNKLKIPTWDEATKPTTNLEIGMMGWNTETTSIEIYNGDDDDGEPIWLSSSGTGGPSGAFPDTYQQLINDFSGAKYYVDPSGSNGNNGSESSPWQSINHATLNAPTGSMIVVNPGTYQQSAPMYAPQGAKIYWDHAKNLQVICAPGQVKLIGSSTDPGTRDLHHIIQTNSASKLYGCIIYRNNNARTSNYSNAVFGYPTPSANTGEVYNTFFRETGTNGNWSLHYDNPNNHSWKAYNSSFMGSTWQSNYTGGSSTTCTNCAGSGSWVSSGTNTSALTSATYNSDFTCQSPTQGVYSGTYAWDPDTVTQTL